VVETETITAARVRQKMYYPADDEKLPLLLGLLSRSEGARTMVFVNTKVFVERVAKALEKAGYRVGVLSGDVPQKKRETLLGRFQKGQLEILVATDVAARGLHINGVSHVYNYDLPFDAEDYVHRIGRTARLGAEGDAISFACERYAMSLPEIEAYIEQKIPSEPVTPELLIAQPRPERVAQDGDGEGESVGTIFREAREQRTADEAKRGSGRRAPRSGDGRARRPQQGDAHATGEGSSDKPRRRRGPRQTSSTVTAAPEVATTQAATPTTATKPPPRKRRRRRHGQPVEGTQTVATREATTNPTPREITAIRASRPTQTAPEPPSLLSRIGQKLRKLVIRAPNGQH